jgi:hypothetical protein
LAFFSERSESLSPRLVDDLSETKTSHLSLFEAE